MRKEKPQEPIEELEAGQSAMMEENPKEDFDDECLDQKFQSLEWKLAQLALDFVIEGDYQKAKKCAEEVRKKEKVTLSDQEKYINSRLESPQSFLAQVALEFVLKDDYEKAKQYAVEVRKIEKIIYGDQEKYKRGELDKFKKSLGEDLVPMNLDLKGQKVLSDQIIDIALNIMTPGQRVYQRGEEVAKQLSQDEITQFLTYVYRGNLEEVEKFLIRDKKFGSAQGDITDLSRREFKQITAFQYAYWALDIEMCELILKYLAKEEAKEQLIVLQEKRPDIVSIHGIHFSLETYLGALKKYLDNYHSWNSSFDQGGEEALADCWCLEVGGAQRGFPVWMIMLMSEEGGDVAWVNKNLGLGFQRNEKYIKEWYSISETNRLGEKLDTKKTWWSSSSGFSWLRGKGKSRGWCMLEAFARSFGYNFMSYIPFYPIEMDYEIASYVGKARFEAMESLGRRLCDSVESTAMNNAPKTIVKSRQNDSLLSRANTKDNQHVNQSVFNQLNQLKQVHDQKKESPNTELKSSSIDTLSAVRKFQDIRSFDEDYSIGTLTYLINMQLSSCLKYVFKSGISNQFIDQLRYLKFLIDEFKCPALFISPAPAEMDSSHFICGVLYDNALLLINPLGESLTKDAIEILRRISDKSSAGHIVETLFISTDKLQKDPDGLFSCGPICVEVVSVLSKRLEEIRFEFAKWKQIPQEKGKVVDQLLYQPVSIRSLCVNDQLESMDTKNAQDVIGEIRLVHFDSLCALELSNRDGNSEVNFDGLMNSPEQVLIFKLAFGGLDINDCDEQDEFKKLKTRLMQYRRSENKKIKNVDVSQAENLSVKVTTLVVQDNDKPQSTLEENEQPGRDFEIQIHREKQIQAKRDKQARKALIAQRKAVVQKKIYEGTELSLINSQNDNDVNSIVTNSIQAPALIEEEKEVIMLCSTILSNLNNDIICVEEIRKIIEMSESIKRKMVCQEQIVELLVTLIDLGTIDERHIAEICQAFQLVKFFSIEPYQPIAKNKGFFESMINNLKEIKSISYSLDLACIYLLILKRAEIKCRKLTAAVNDLFMAINKGNSNLPDYLITEIFLERLKELEKNDTDIEYQVKVQKDRIQGARVIKRGEKASRPLSQKDINNFLLLVYRGNLGKVKQLLDTNRSFALVYGDLKDLSDRSFKQISALQYCYWAMDEEMWELLLKYLPQEEARKQLLTFENERNDILREYGLHYSLNNYLTALKKYFDNYDNWVENYHNGGERTMADCWCLEVGGSERCFPAWMIMLMNEEGKDAAWIKNDLSMGFKRDEKYLDKWLVNDKSHHLGGKPATRMWWDDPGCGFSWVRGSGSGVGLRWESIVKVNTRWVTCSSCSGKGTVLIGGTSSTGGGGGWGYMRCSSCSGRGNRELEEKIREKKERYYVNVVCGCDGKRACTVLGCKSKDSKEGIRLVLPGPEGVRIDYEFSYMVQSTRIQGIENLRDRLCLSNTTSNSSDQAQNFKSDLPPHLPSRGSELRLKPGHYGH